MSLDTARWYRGLGVCRGGCGRLATGQLMDHRNDVVGAYCSRCADRAIKRADALERKERTTETR